MNLMQGDCLEKMKGLPDNSVDSIITDPPYGISFMAKKWDYDVPSVEVWREAMRVLKPGGHALIACGTRTQHRMVVNIEDAGFEIRDVVSWIYGSGFPKSLNISKAIDKAAGAEREVVGESEYAARASKSQPYKQGEQGATDNRNITAPATPEAKQWDGWGTALKPACEFFTLARKPLSEKTIAKNVLKWGTGGINIDGCRVETDEKITNHSRGSESAISKGKYGDSSAQETHQTAGQTQGRFPANLIHDGSQEVLELFPETKSGIIKSHHKASELYGRNSFNKSKTVSSGDRGFGDQGSAARFFYSPKASKKDRDEGNCHPTVKPTNLMRYLCRLITPTEGTVLDPYMGSGSTGKAARLEGFDFIGCELDQEYFNIAKARITSNEEH